MATKVKLRAYGNTGAGTEIAQPDSGLQFNYETTYTEDSGRVQSGEAVVAPMFTVKAYGYSKTNPTTQEVATILGFIANGGKFEMFCFNPKTAQWEWDVYYVGQGSMNIGSLDPLSGHYSGFSFNAIGVNPI